MKIKARCGRLIAYSSYEPRPKIAMRALVAVIGLSAVLALAGAAYFRRGETVQITSLRQAPRMSSMPRFGRDEILDPSEISDLTQYVLALSARETDQEAVLRALPLYDRNCAACHGPGGEGSANSGAPDLTDDDWIHGGSAADIGARIWAGDDDRGPLRRAERVQTLRLRP